MPPADKEVQRAIEYWKAAVKTEYGLAIASNHREYLARVLAEARKIKLGTEDVYKFRIITPENPEDEVWLIRSEDETGRSEELELSKVREEE